MTENNLQNEDYEFVHKEPKEGTLTLKLRIRVIGGVNDRPWIADEVEVPWSNWVLYGSDRRQWIHHVIHQLEMTAVLDLTLEQRNSPDRSGQTLLPWVSAESEAQWQKMTFGSPKNETLELIAGVIKSLETLQRLLTNKEGLNVKS